MMRKSKCGQRQATERARPGGPYPCDASGSLMGRQPWERCWGGKGCSQAVCQDWEGRLVGNLEQASGRGEKEQFLSERRKEGAPSYVIFQTLESTEGLSPA